MGQHILVLYENIAFVKISERYLNRTFAMEKISVEEWKNGMQYLVDAVREMPPDYIVIGAGEEIVSLARKFFVDCCGYEQERIINFYGAYQSLLKLPKIQKVMSNPRYDQIRGIIIGLSHAETGLVSSMFSQSTCNIATGGQDLYYNLKSLEWCIRHHKHHLKDLEYAVLDMYDYSYFNVDTSKGKNAVNYYLNWDGYIWDGHHFDENKNFNINFEQLVSMIDTYRYKNTSKQEVETFQNLYPYIMELTNWEEYNDDYKTKGICKIVTDKELEEYDVESSVIMKKFPDTVAENTACFEKILIELKKINPDIRIKVMIQPRTYYVEKKIEKYDKLLSGEYYRILNAMKEKYGIEIYDLKRLEEISRHYEYYYDGEHLNRAGAEAFTRYFVQNCM